MVMNAMAQTEAFAKAQYEAKAFLDRLNAPGAHRLEDVAEELGIDLNDDEGDAD